MVQQNAASSEEMAATAEELSAQAEMLRNTIDFFTAPQITQKSSQDWEKVLDVIRTLPDATLETKALADAVIKTIMTTTNSTSVPHAADSRLEKEDPVRQSATNDNGQSAAPHLSMPHSKHQDELDNEFERF